MGRRRCRQGRLKEYDWLHLHHEDFTGQYSKFYMSYAGAPWLQEMVQRNQAMAKALGFPNVPALKKSAVAQEIARLRRSRRLPVRHVHGDRDARPGARAADGVDIAAAFADGTPRIPTRQPTCDWDPDAGVPECAAGAEPRRNAGLLRHRRPPGQHAGARQPLGAFTLFDFSAKIDPVPTMLVQNHRDVMPDFYGLTTSFPADRSSPA